MVGLLILLLLIPGQHLAETLVLDECRVLTCGNCPKTE